MDIATLDFETAYSSEYSLSKMTTEEYINDPRFEIIGCAVKVNDSDTHWIKGDDMDSLKIMLPWDEMGLVCHNMVFDGAILAWRLGIRPKMYFDTLSMARPFHNANVGGSLKKLTEHYELGAKGTEVIHAMGKWLKDFSPEDLARYGEYCVNDVELTRMLFDIFMGKIPAKELRLIDLTMRMYINPHLVLDPSLLQLEIDLDKERKEALYAKLSTLKLGDKALSSNDQFATVLRSLGVEPPTKVSLKTGKKTYAFAKGDSDFLALLDHEDEMVVAAINARLGSKSTQKQTRAASFLGLHSRMSTLPVALTYYGGHTGRYGGGEKQNLQNLPRAKKNDPNSGLLRKAIMAPAGHSLVVVDYSQIEARFLAWLAQQGDKLEAFAGKRDVYSEQASVIYGRKVDRKANPDDFTPGFIGKAVVLGAGYGLGYLKFARMIYTGMLGEKGILFDDSYADTLGVDVPLFNVKMTARGQLEKIMLAQPIDLDEDEWITHCAVAQKIINVFRDSNSCIPDLWKKADQALNAMYANDPDQPYAFGGPDDDLLVIEGHSILLPNGMRVAFEGLQYSQQDGFSCLRRKEGKTQRVKTYGGAVVENCVQALARIPTTDIMLKADRLGLDVVLQVHDEIVVSVPDEVAEASLGWMIREMRKPPKWARGLPLDAEGGIGKRYGDAK